MGVSGGGRCARTSDAKSPTTPRCASLSGLTTEPMQKPLRRLLALLVRSLELDPPIPALLDVTPGPARQLAHVVLALADDLCDLPIAVVEHVVQQQRGSLLGRQALEHHQHRQRQRVGHLGVLGGIVDAVTSGNQTKPRRHDYEP